MQLPINIDLAIQSFRQLIPMLSVIIIFSLLLLFAILITWQLTKRNYEDYIRETIDQTADNILSRYEAKIMEVEKLQAQASVDKQQKKELRAMIVRLLEKL